MKIPDQMRPNPNHINGKPLVFGDKEQIAWLKFKRKAADVAANGPVDISLSYEERSTITYTDFAVFSFDCPFCNKKHTFDSKNGDAIICKTDCGRSFKFEDDEVVVIV